MIDPRVVLAILAASLLYYGAVGVAHGVKAAGKKVKHEIVHVLRHGVHPHHDAPPPDEPPTDEPAKEQ